MSEKSDQLIERYGRDGARKLILTLLARSEDSPDGFAAFYELLYGRRIPDIVLHEWVIPMYLVMGVLSEDEVKKYTEQLTEYWKKWGVKYIPLDWKGLKGTLIEAFRGSTKSTTWQAFGAYRIGKEPEKTNLIISSGDDTATDISKDIKHIIENDDGFKLVFPHVVPDPESQWGERGYDVKRTDIRYEEFRAKKRKEGRDPTFVGLSWQSSALIGKHPTGFLCIDDIHNEQNTMSERIQSQVKTTVQGTIIPMLMSSTWLCVIGTPWNYSDVMAMLKATGRFAHGFTPVYRNVNGKRKPVWPEERGEDWIQVKKDMTDSKVEFARMYELDLELTKGLVLKRDWLEPRFQHEDIKREWPAIIFIDYSSTENPAKEKSDYFALAVGQFTPDYRKIVISDGVYRRVTHLDAQRIAIHKILEYPNVITVGVEAIFTGSEYHHVLEQNQELLDNGIYPEACRGGPWGRKKGHRFEFILADAVRKGLVQLSTAENELIINFGKEWIGWQGDTLADQGHDDALDAVFGVTHLAMQYLVHGGKHTKNYQNPLFPRKKKGNVLGTELGRNYG